MPVYGDIDFYVCDGVDTTKQVRLECSGITTNTIRALTVPDADGTICLTGTTLAHYGITDAQGLDTQLTQLAALTAVAGDLIIGNADPIWARLALGTSGKFLKAGAALPSWESIAETDIADGSLLARVGDTEVITGDWSIRPSIGGSLTFDIFSDPGGSSYELFLISDGFLVNHVSVVASGEITDNRVITIPVSASGTLALTGTTLAHYGITDAQGLDAQLTQLAGQTAVRGDILTGQDATPTWKRLAKGTDGQYLKSGADDAAWATIAEADIADGSVFPRLGASESITGAWTHTNAELDLTRTTDGVALKITCDSGVQVANLLEIYDSGGSTLAAFIGSDGAWYGNVAIASGSYYGTLATAALSAYRTYTFPNFTGTVALLSGSQTFTAKTLDATCTLTPSATAIARLGTATVDMKTAASTTLVTTPSGKVTRIVAVTVRNPTDSLAGCTDVSFTNWRQNVDLSSMTTAATSYLHIDGNNAAYIEIAASTAFQITITTGSTAAANATLDVWAFVE